MRTRVILAVPLWLFVLPLASAGCARGESAEERQLAQLSESLTGVQNDNERFERRLTSADLEANAKPPPTPATKPGAVRAPSQRVVQLAPDGVEQSQSSAETASTLNGDDPDDTSPRPSIKVQGIPGARSRRGLSTGGVQQIVETLPDDAPNGGQAGPPIQAGAPKPSALDPAAKAAYDAALALVNGKQYAQALEAFASFLVRWPDHPNADNATYWRGECYFAQGEFARAAEQFEGVATRFPLGNKVPDALLKLGLSQEKLGNPQKAAQTFQRLQRDFPRAEATRRIRTQSGDAPAPRREVTR